MKTLTKLSESQLTNSNIELISEAPMETIMINSCNITVNNFINQDIGDSGVSLIDNNTLNTLVAMASANKYYGSFQNEVSSSIRRLERTLNSDMMPNDIISALRKMTDELSNKAHVAQVISSFKQHQQQLAFEAQVSSYESSQEM